MFNWVFVELRCFFNQISKYFYPFFIKDQIDEEQINLLYEKQKQEFKNLAQKLKLFNRNI